MTWRHSWGACAIWKAESRDRAHGSHRHRPAALFDEVWRRADSLPIMTRDEPALASGGRSDAEERLIALLLSGLTDQAIARQLGIGHRTVQRRVAGLAQDLGAHSRFQAGVQVALRQPRGETG